MPHVAGQGAVTVEAQSREVASPELFSEVCVMFFFI